MRYITPYNVYSTGTSIQHICLFLPTLPRTRREERSYLAIGVGSNRISVRTTYIHIYTVSIGRIVIHVYELVMY